MQEYNDAGDLIVEAGSRLIVGGIKFDSEKIRLDLIPSEMLEEVGKVLTFGAKKYGDNNWLEGMAWWRLYGATLRHLLAWWMGQKKDEESGLLHLAHAIACISFLLVYEEYNIGEDTRK